MNTVSNSTLAYIERNRRTGEQRRLKTRARLIRAAVQVISANGIEAPIIDDFIAAAEISRGSFYNNFNTKEELVEAVAEWLRVNMLRTNEEAARFIRDPAERAAWSTRWIVRQAGSDPQIALLLQTETQRISSFRNAVRRGPIKDIRSCIAQGRLPRQNIDIAVDFACGATQEAARAAMAGGRPEDHAEQTATLILRGLGMPSEEAYAVARRPLYVLQERSELSPQLAATA